MQDQKAQGRRSLLVAGVGAVGAWLAGALGRPSPAAATTGAMQFGASQDAGDSTTTLTSSNGFATFHVTNSTFSPAIEAGGLGGAISALGSGAGYAASYGRNDKGYGIVGDAGDGSSNNTAGVWGRSFGTANSVGVYGTNRSLTAVMGYADPASQPGPSGPPALTGVYGYSPSGVGVRARSKTGTALLVSGKAKFDRSGLATIVAGAQTVDITPTGGIASNTLITATLQAYRPGVSIAAVRPNFPSMGVARIYLTKVASASESTPVAWIATEWL